MDVFDMKNFSIKLQLFLEIYDRIFNAHVLDTTDEDDKYCCA